ncbi:MAG: hypothetical protein EOP05_05555 [Proteobacteria bacterium]|nr:MAG: hypothetical protein EOP05_05555 [Pseudomonadota bacterium]
MYHGEDIQRTERAREALGIWIAAFYRNNSADYRNEALVPVGANKFTITDSSHKKFEMPPFATASRSEVEKVLKWLLEDKNRMAYATASLSILFEQLAGGDYGGYYGTRALKYLPMIAKKEVILHPRIGPHVAEIFRRLEKQLYVDYQEKPAPKLLDTEEALKEMEKDIQRRKDAIREKPVAIPLDRSRRKGFQDLDVALQAKSHTFMDYAKTRMALHREKLTQEVKRSIFDFIITHPSGFLGEFGVAIVKMGRVSGIGGAFDLRAEASDLNKLSALPASSRALMGKQLLLGEQILTLIADAVQAPLEDFTTVINTQDVGYRNRMASMQIHLPKKFLNEKELQAFKNNLRFIHTEPEYVEYAQLLLAEASAHFAKLPDASAFGRAGVFGRLTLAGRAASSIRDLKSRLHDAFLVETAAPQVTFAEREVVETKFVNLPALPPLQYAPETDQLRIDVAPLMEHIANDFALVVSGHSASHMERWSNNQLDILDIVLERYKTLETRLFDMRDLSAAHFDSLLKPVASRADGTARLMTADAMGGLRDHAKGVIDLKADADRMRAYVSEVLGYLKPMSAKLAEEASKDPSFKPVSDRYANSLARSTEFLSATDARLKTVSDSISSGYREVKEAVVASSDHVASDNVAAASRIRAAAAALRAAR